MAKLSSTIDLGMRASIRVNISDSFERLVEMKEISVEKAKEIADEKKLHPGLVRGTAVVQFTKGGNPMISIISWDRFKDLLRERNLKIMESNGWMKIFSR